MACNIRLQFPTKNSVNETTALTGIGNSWGLPTRLSMEHIENSNEELVSILLLVAQALRTGAYKLEIISAVLARRL